MSTCTKVSGVLTPCENLGKVIGSVNVELAGLAVSTVAVHQYTDTEGGPTEDVVFAVSSQGDNEALPFKVCPYCGESIE